MTDKLIALPLAHAREVTLTQLTNLQKAAGRWCGNRSSPAMPLLAGTL